MGGRTLARVGGLISLAWLAGCDREDFILKLSPPPSTRALFLGMMEGGAELEIQAFELGNEATSASFTAHRLDEQATFYALGYRESLERFHVKPGVVQSAPGDETNTRALPAPGEGGFASSGTVRAGQFDGWSPLVHWPPALLDFLEHGFEWLPPGPSDKVTWAEGRRIGGALKLFTLGHGGVLASFDAERSTWTQLAVEEPSTTYRGLAILEDGEVVTASSRRDHLLRYKDGQPRPDYPAPARNEAFAELRWIPGLGLVAFTDLGDTYLNDTAGWRHLEGQPGQQDRLGVYAFASAPFEQGFVIWGSQAANLQYVPGFGFCPPDTGVFDDVRRVTPVGRDLVLRLSPFRSDVQGFVWLERQPP